MTLRDELRHELTGWGVKVDDSLHDHTSLIVSGLLDSVGLFQLLLWVEEKTGATIDPGTVDLRREWDSVGAILRFIQERRGG